MNCFVTVLLLAIPVACISWTVTREDIFRELREYCHKWCEKGECNKGWKNMLCKKISYLPTCYYCFSHWVALWVMFIHPVTLVDNGWKGYTFAFFTLVFISNVYLSTFHILRSLQRLTKAKADAADVKD